MKTLCTLLLILLAIPILLAQPRTSSAPYPLIELR